MELEGKKKEWWEKEISKIATGFTILVSAVAFILRGFWYLYQLGYYKAIGVNRIYIEIEGIGTMYYILVYIGVAGLLIISNYFVYSFLLCKKRKYLMVLIVIEVFLFSALSIVFANVEFISILTEMIKYRQQKEFLKLIIGITLFIIFMNIYGIYFGVTSNKGKKKQFGNNSERTVYEDIFSDKKKAIIFIILIIIIEGFLIFVMGMKSGYKRNAYKVIFENMTTDYEEKIEDRYIFTMGKNKVRIYPILFENQEVYIVSYLCRNDEKIYIESTHQKMISKEGIETVYCKNIFVINDDRKTNSVNNAVIEEKNTEERHKMLDTLVGAIIGAVFGGIGTYIVESKKMKKEKLCIESHAASLLYYDLKSIEQYIKDEKQFVNLRYSDEWQRVVSNCSFLDDGWIMYLYRIYDEVYNYNDSFAQMSKFKETFIKEKLSSYVRLKSLLFDVQQCNEGKFIYNENYKKVMEELSKIKDRK